MLRDSLLSDTGWLFFAIWSIVIGALSVENAARHLNTRDVDGLIIGDGFGPSTIEAFLTALAADSRFRDLPIGVVAEIEQDIAADEVTLLGADRQHPQRSVSQQAQCRDTLEKRYVVVD